jgi:formylglycine-generating enzyme required for sulfatase activity
VNRGGSWLNIAILARVSLRDYFTPAYRDYDFGFRPARSSVP